LSWFDHDHPGALADVFAGMWPRWADPAGRQILQAAVALLVDSTAEVNLESRIVLAQAALERLAWQRLVIEGTWSRRKFKGTDAADKLRGLLAACGASAALPPAFTALAATPGLGSPADGPAFVVNVRNATVHPPRSGSHFLPSPAVVAAWRLAVEYEHRALLAWLGYRGPGISMVDFNPTTFP
jgi:hypothetical protein